MNALSLKKKFIKLYARQLIVISVATIISTWVASYVIENILIKKAMMQEAEHFWQLYQSNTEQPVPNTNNLRGYLLHNPDSTTAIDASTSSVPHNFQPGFGRVTWQNVKSLYYVSDYAAENGPSTRLYLFFLEENVNKLVLIFGILPLSLLLLLFYASSWIAYLHTKGLMSPLQKLAQRVSQHRFDEQQVNTIVLNDLKANADIEVLSLIQALEQFNQHLMEFISRERAFTRDASHELRTPVAIIKGSLDMLARLDASDTLKREKYLSKIRETCNAMEQLITTLLLLAHNPIATQQVEKLSLNTLVTDIIDKHHPHYQSDTLKISVQCDHDCTLSVPITAANIIIENLIENAFKYTQEGCISIQVDPNKLILRDTGEGMDANTLSQAFTPFYRSTDTEVAGFGLGLPLVKRLCESLNWSLEINSQRNEGTRVVIRFPQEQIIDG